MFFKVLRRCGWYKWLFPLSDFFFFGVCCSGAVSMGAVSMCALERAMVRTVVVAMVLVQAIFGRPSLLSLDFAFCGDF